MTAGTGTSLHSFGLFLVLILLWSLAWKGWALWLAARRHEKIWFILLLLLNTAGIVEIIYIFLIAKRSDKPDRTPKKETAAEKDTASK